MTKRWTRGVFAFLLAFPLIAQAGDPMKDAFAVLPSDALAAVVIPSLKQLDTDYQQIVKDLGLDTMIPPPFNGSFVTAAKMMMPPLAGVDENGSVSLVLMPVQNPYEINDNMVFAIPVAEPKAVLEGLGAKAGDGGIWEMNLMGQPAFAVVAEKRIFLAKSAAVAKKVTEGKPGLDDKLKPTDLKSMENLDLAIWIDGDRLMKMLKPQIDMLTGMMVAMQASSSPLGAKQGEATKKQIDLWVDGVASFFIGLGADKPGVNLRFGFASKSGSKLQESMLVKTTTESLLKGLPGSQYILAFGGMMDPKATKTTMDSVDVYFDMLGSMEGIDKDKVGQLKTQVGDWLGLTTGLRFMVEGLPGNGEGLFGISGVIETSDSKNWVELTGKTVDLAKSIVTEAKNEKIDNDVKKGVSAITFAADAETIGGTKVSQLKIDISKIDDVDEEDREEMEKILGKDGFAFRFAAPDANSVTMSFGGGTASMERLIQSVKNKDAGLDGNAGIKRVAAQLPTERASVMYLAVDQLIAAINNVAKAADEEGVPVQIPAGTGPVAMTSTGGSDWARIDILVPSDLMIAGKNAIMTMTGGGGAPPPAPANPEAGKKAGM